VDRLLRGGDRPGLTAFIQASLDRLSFDVHAMIMNSTARLSVRPVEEPGDHSQSPVSVRLGKADHESRRWLLTAAI